MGNEEMENHGDKLQILAGWLPRIKRGIAFLSRGSRVAHVRMTVGERYSSSF